MRTLLPGSHAQAQYYSKSNANFHFIAYSRVFQVDAASWSAGGHLKTTDEHGCTRILQVKAEFLLFSLRLRFAQLLKV